MRLSLQRYYVIKNYIDHYGEYNGLSFEGLHNFSSKIMAHDLYLKLNDLCEDIFSSGPSYKYKKYEKNSKIKTDDYKKMLGDINEIKKNFLKTTSKKNCTIKKALEYYWEARKDISDTYGGSWEAYYERKRKGY